MVSLPRNDPKEPPNVLSQLLALNLFAISIGTNKSKANVSSTTMKKIIVVTTEILSKPVPKAKINSPNHAIKAPGINGRMVPTKPMSINIVLIMANITLCICF